MGQRIEDFSRLSVPVSVPVGGGPRGFPNPYERTRETTKKCQNHGFSETKWPDNLFHKMKLQDKRFVTLLETWIKQYNHVSWLKICFLNDIQELLDD
jgi:hypothetical protein